VSAADPLSLLLEVGALGLRVTDLADSTAAQPVHPGVVKLGVHRSGPLSTVGLDGYDILLTSEFHPPCPWVGAGPEGLDAAVAELQAAVAAQPVAAAVAVQVLRMTLAVTFEQALVLESLAYSMLLASAPFRAWRAATPRSGDADDTATPRVTLERKAGALHIRLTRPASRNAVDAHMRDALVEALAFAELDPEVAPVILSGEGASFSVGGDLDEFATFGDPGQAHAIRTLQSAALGVLRLGDRITARLHGACIGSGIEIPAAARHVTARPHTLFRLPEVSMGLIPGAGGTATVTRRIGRRRAGWMMLTGCTLDTATALDWGLVDAVERRG
jgi:hypothetical protein